MPIRSRLTLQVLVAAALLAALAWPAAATDPVNQTLFGGYAIKGYDTVAYFELDRPAKGDKSYAHDWNGATWLFVSAEHRDLFAADPEQYAPQYGGYCAWAVSQGDTANIDPKAWKLVDGKLYLNYSPKIQRQWEQDTAENILRADSNWPKILAER